MKNSDLAGRREKIVSTATVDEGNLLPDTKAWVLMMNF